MSAYIVERRHIAYMIEAATSRRLGAHKSQFSWYHNGERHVLPQGDIARAVEVGSMLWKENVVSVCYRYPNCSSADLPGPIGESYAMEETDFYKNPFEQPDPVQVLKACDCYFYQSCEHPDWEASESFAFIQALRARAWHALPGYDDAAWGAPEPKTAGAR